MDSVDTEDLLCGLSCAMAGVDLMAQYEGADLGVTWGNIWEEEFSMAWIFVLFLVDCLLYGLLAWYVALSNSPAVHCLALSSPYTVVLKALQLVLWTVRISSSHLEALLTRVVLRYLEQVLPSEYGGRLPPWFFLTSSYWHGDKKYRTEYEVRIRIS